MRNVFVVIPAALIILLGFLFLQVFLSKRASKWPGLMLPVICFCVALAGSGYQVYEWSAGGDGGAFGWIGSSVAFFFTYNILTVVLLVIFFACRERNRRRQALDKMNIQDLE